VARQTHGTTPLRGFCSILLVHCLYVRNSENMNRDGSLPAEVIYYQEDGEAVPLVDWLEELPPKALQKCLARLERLEQLGHELRRPEADYLRDDIYELRASCQGVHYRMLYFFHKRSAVVVAHGLTKERAVPPREIDLAMRRKQRFDANPKRHTFKPKG
jgi:phage-related protein